jgi:UDP-glucose 4-epimerase
MSEKILVTGGCGFIGSNLVDELVKQKNHVIVIDNLSAESNEKFYFNDNASYIHEDILNFSAVKEAMKGCDRVFHLAAESRIGPSIENPAKACQVNVVGTCNVLTAARDLSVKSFIYSSTSACYGLSDKMPQSESDQIDNLNPYSSSKYAGEDLALMFHKLWGLNVTALRYFNVYGERMPYKGIYAPVIGIFLRQKKADEVLTIVGDGEQKRDFIHVSDIVNANILAYQNKLCRGRVYNVGSGRAYSINEIAARVSNRSTHIQARAGEARNTLADTTCLKRDSGWMPKIDIMEWIDKEITR